ncbi:Uu.00g067050.m01.CDS01 [Anthostomella pinea]|uniref:Uu.00g067050.m01.CDS01 n=1 Tax=Anthostomella pinea TaxID=933095 RepID=A0AAI8VUQ5_9PEZI|nr:Uu.00g067050.m01.CDS01 [Anthostomella pinea]
MAATRPLCLICEAIEGKYKCPRCNEYTCSVACSREHRDNHPDVEAADTTARSSTMSNSAQSFLAPSEQSNSTTANVELNSVADMPEYQDLVQRYPVLKQLLWDIAVATDPPVSDGHGGGLSNVGLPGPRPAYRKNNQPWTKDVGMEHGLDALQQAKHSPTAARDAIREFCDLVSMFKSRKKDEDDFRKQLLQADAKIISRLMKEEDAA